MAFSINLLAFYQECCPLIGYATHYLFCCSQRVAQQCALVYKMTAASLRLRSVCEEGLYTVLNDQLIYTEAIRTIALDFYTRQKSRAHVLIAKDYFLFKTVSLPYLYYLSHTWAPYILKAYTVNFLEQTQPTYVGTFHVRKVYLSLQDQTGFKTNATINVL